VSHKFPYLASNLKHQANIQIMQHLLRTVSVYKTLDAKYEQPRNAQRRPFIPLVL